MKKIAMHFGLVALLATASVTGMAQTSNPKTPLCTVENCQRTTAHEHNNRTYAGHYIGDGHDSHLACDLENCQKTGSHYHDGQVHLPHNDKDGHSYHQGNHKSGKRSGRNHH